MESSAKHQRMIGENPKSELLILTDQKYPRFEVKFGGEDAFREPLIIDAEEYIGVKSFKAKGKRVSNLNVDSIKQIEPREGEEDAEQKVAVADQDLDVVANDEVIDQEAVRDELTGQMRMFDGHSAEEN